MPTDFQLLLSSLPQRLQRHQSLLDRALDTVFNEQVSNYPVLLAHTQPLDMGVFLFQDAACLFSMSTLEELYVKQLVQAEYVDEFRALYKARSAAHYVVLCLSEAEAQWVFAPKRGSEEN